MVSRSGAKGSSSLLYIFPIQNDNCECRIIATYPEDMEVNARKEFLPQSHALVSEINGTWN